MPRDNSLEVFIRGFGQAKYEKNFDSSLKTENKLTEATNLALKQSGLKIKDIDGLGVSSFTLIPDRAIDLAVKFGIKPRWIMDGGTGGASGVDLAQHAMRAIQADDAKNILLVAGDVFHNDDFTNLVSHYNVNTEASSVNLGISGPNSNFALLTEMQMSKHGLLKKDYSLLVRHQRDNAVRNANAVYRTPLSVEQYLTAPEVSRPLGIFDCVPVVAGANAIILSKIKNENELAVRIRKIAVLHNWDLHEGDGTVTGLSRLTESIWEDTDLTRDDVNLLSLYDDYPAIVIAQLIDLGFLKGENVSEELQQFIAGSKPILNSSGGQLSAGQCGAGAGLHGFIEAMNGLRKGGIALVSGYGMVVNRYGACSNLAILEATR